MTLERQAMQFLRFEKRCPVAVFERHPFGYWQPDVLGVTKSRYLLEIEIKRSLSDFRADSHKAHIARRTGQGDTASDPKFFWYLVTKELAEKILPFVPPWAGLMRAGDNNRIERSSVVILKPAPVNSLAKRLTPKQSVKLAQCMANQIYSLVLSGEARDRYHLEPEYSI